MSSVYLPLDQVRNIENQMTSRGPKTRPSTASTAAVSAPTSRHARAFACVCGCGCACVLADHQGRHFEFHLLIRASQYIARDPHDLRRCDFNDVMAVSVRLLTASQLRLPKQANRASQNHGPKYCTGCLALFC